MKIIQMKNKQKDMKPKTSLISIMRVAGLMMSLSKKAGSIMPDNRKMGNQGKIISIKTPANQLGEKTLMKLH